MKPSKILFTLEFIRSKYEYYLGCVLNSPIQHISPKGDGHPVIVIPGLGSTDRSTAYMRKFIDDLGYKSYPWGLGRNVGPKGGVAQTSVSLVNTVTDIYRANDCRQVSIIGWSLGGIYAREVAKEVPSVVRQVISIGSPFKGIAGSTNAEFIYRILSGDTSYKNPDMIQRISEPPPVPFTSIYSKSDGVVSWQASIEDCHHCENIEVPFSSHLGLAHNPITMYIVANKLHNIQEFQNPVDYRPYAL